LQQRPRPTSSPWRRTALAATPLILIALAAGCAASDEADVSGDHEGVGYGPAEVGVAPDGDGGADRGASDPASGRERRPDPGSAERDREDQVDPVAFLDAWVAGDAGAASEDVAGWVRDEHVPALLARMDSDRPAAHIVSAKSSFLPMERTTEGHLAMYLLACHARGRFPLLLGSHSDPFEGEPDWWRRWWRMRQRCDRLSLVRWDDLDASDVIVAATKHAGSAAILPSYPPFRWVGPEEVPGLMGRIRSDTRAATLVFPGTVLERIPGPTTEGRTAMLFLHLFRASLQDRHALLTTTLADDFEDDPAVWDAWFRQWSAK